MNTLTKEYLALGLLMCISCLLFAFSVAPWHNWGDDYASYIMQAQSILQGNIADFIEKNTYMVNNTDDITMAPVAYPWGLPLYLAVVISAFGTSVYFLKISIFLTFLAFISLLYVYLRKLLTPRQNFFILACFALNSYMYAFMQNILSDIPFMLLSTWGIFFLHDAMRHKALTIKKLLIFTLIVWMTASIRGNGILLLCLVPIVQIVTFVRFRNKEILFYVAPYALYLLLGFGYKLIFPAQSSAYMSIFQVMTVDTIIANIKYYSVIFSQFFLIPSPYGLMLFSMTIPSCICGMYKNFSKDYLFIIYSALTIALLIVFPPTQGLRYVFPVLPFWLYFTIIGIGARLDKMPIKYLALCTCLLFSITHLTYKQHGSLIQSPYSKNSQEVFAYIRNNTEENARITFFKPRALRLETGRNSMWKAHAGDLNYDYILHYKYQSPNTIPSDEIKNLVKNGQAQLVFANDDFHLLKIIKK